MTIRFSTGTVESLEFFLRRAQRALFFGGVVLLGYCACTILDAWSYQVRQSHSFDEQLREGTATNIRRQESKMAHAQEVGPMVPADDLVGRLEIARLGLSVIVVEGVGKSDLIRAVGHIPSTAMPDQGGNIGIAGHRDTFFRPLEGIRLNDLVTLTTPSGEYHYQVVGTRVVSPKYVEVLDPIGEDVLTLVTCYPFYFAGPAPQRFIVRAERTKTEGLI